MEEEAATRVGALCSGCLLLEDCPVVIPTRVSAPCETNNEKQWVDVSVRHGQSCRANTEQQIGSGVCPHCELVLHSTSSTAADESDQEKEYCIDLSSTGSFGGTVDDLSPTECCSLCSSTEKRTDAALVAALLYDCCTTADIDVRLQILLHDGDDDGESTSHDDVGKHPSKWRRTAASFVWHVSFPNVFTEGSILKSGHAKSRKLLNQSLQLLLLLLEHTGTTDLERRKQQLMLQDKHPESSEMSFFPVRFRLESMYQRIIDRNRRRQKQSSVGNPPQGAADTSQSSSILSLTTLPTELLTIHIAPFCNATSLARWRACNRRFHWALRSIVPGLRAPMRLYKHQVDSLVWMRSRERPLTEDMCWEQKQQEHRAVTGGATTRLGDVVLCTTTGRVVAAPPPTTLCRHVAQGGLLCDDPGLGKTITVLSLVLQTSPESMRIADRDDGEKEVQDPTEKDIESDAESIFRAYWSEQVVLEFRIRALLKLLNDLARTAPPQVSTVFYPLRKSIEANELGADFALFERVVEDTLSTVDPHMDTEIESSRGNLTDNFRRLIAEFKASQQRSARKSFSNATSKPNSSVAAMIEDRTRQRYLQSLVPTKGTLIVTPSVLVDHWKNQIEQHIDLTYWTRRRALVFEYLPMGQGMTVDRATILCELEKTHDAVVFLDKAGTRPLPSADFLAKFRIVITSTSRFQNGWKQGSFQEEIAQSRGEAFDPREFTRCCELLKLHWNRMVIDEGHSMGSSRNNSTIQFASSICSKRRWAMTGTPTKHNATQLGQLNRLLSFLEHGFFTARLNGHAYWKKHIASGWRAGCLASYFRLYHLLCFIMKRHTKLDIAELPPPVFSQTRIPMSFTECKTYNTFVSSVQLNLLMTSMEGKTSGAQDSLLHRSQTGNARLTLQSIRRVCTGYARAGPTVPIPKYYEFTQMANASGLPKSAVTRLRSCVNDAVDGELTRCDMCRLELSILVLMVCCGGLICTECMDSKTKTCYLCDSSFDVDELQQFQPGFVVAWKDDQNSNISDPNLRSKHSTQSVESLVRPPKVRRKSRRFGDGHECQYDPLATDGICDLCLVEHADCNLMNKQLRCPTCHRSAEECPKHDSKFSYLIGKLLQLHENQQARAELVSHCHSRPLKVIVFSQFRAALNLVGHRLLKRFGTACVAEYFGKHRREELRKFTHSPECFVLLLTKDGGEGLDLSFVTNIFFLEEIYDKAVQHQAVARAWRMGASQSVQVETLVARNSVEETMAQQTQPTVDSEPIVDAEDKQRLKVLLQSLSCVTDFHNFAAGGAASAPASVNISTSRAPKEPPGRQKRDHAVLQLCSAPPSKKVKFSLPVAKRGD